MATNKKKVVKSNLKAVRLGERELKSLEILRKKFPGASDSYLMRASIRKAAGIK